MAPRICSLPAWRRIAWRRIAWRRIAWGSRISWLWPDLRRGGNRDLVDGMSRLRLTLTTSRGMGGEFSLRITDR
ncbi:hypothetical protein [Nocardia sp. No.11]|uniref:hypothetical protein n=1 Tax=Nocardia sp. No.11 TaxID=3128861 RepID=UPI00319E0B43